VAKSHVVKSHVQMYKNAQVANNLIELMSAHLGDSCVGNISEIFDVNPPFNPRGCFTQVWSVAEVLRS